MVFTSISFLFLFLPLALATYFVASATKKIQIQNFILLCISAIFYAWSGVGACLLLLASAVVNFFLGCQLNEENKSRKQIFIITLVFNLSILGFFKYFNFIIENIEFLIRISLPEYHIPAPVIPLPVGISFFTFQILSYQIDVYKGNVKSQKRLLDLMLYIMLFPQLIAGPIVRYIDVEQEIEQRHTNYSLFQDGVRRFILGFSKKVLLADRMGYMADQIFMKNGSLATPYAWLGVFCYSLQIYLDFSAYSDMAIGLGSIFGFHFLENFNYPFIAKSIKEFWNRWHISLSTWFRDYVYFPLGGSRKGRFRTYYNILFIFFLTGLWHGASWTFIVWGTLQGIFICLERIGLDKLLKRLPSVLRHAYVLIIFMISMAFFYYDKMSDSLSYLHSLFIWNMDGIKNIDILLLLDRENLFFVLCSVIACTPAFKIMAERKGEVLEALGNVFISVAFILAVCYRMSSGFNPFIYFRF